MTEESFRKLFKTGDQPELHRAIVAAEALQNAEELLEREAEVSARIMAILGAVGVQCIGKGRNRDQVFEQATSQLIPLGEVNPAHPFGRTHGFAEVFLKQAMQVKPKRAIRLMARTFTYVPGLTNEIFGVGLRLFSGHATATPEELSLESTAEISGINTGVQSYYGKPSDFLAWYRQASAETSQLELLETSVPFIETAVGL